jgi:hypothetical protein
MVEVRRSGAVRSMISWRNVQQSTDRIARIVFNVAVCRSFLRAVWLLVIDRQSMVIARHDEYRPRIDLLEMSSFVGLSPE